MAFDPDRYLAEKSAPGGFDPDAYLKEKGVAQPEAKKSTFEAVKDAVATGARHIPILGTAFNPAVQDAALRGLDYVGGLARTGIAGVGGLATKQDFVKAVEGLAPRSSEYMTRAGVPDGPKVPLTNISARDVGGFAADMATDPLTYYAPAEILGEMGQATSATGKTMYKSGLKRIDEETARFGKEPVSDLLMKERVTGSAKSIAEQMDALAADRLAKRNSILGTATANGAEVDLNRAMQVPQSMVDKLRGINNPEQGQALNTLQDRINDYANRAGEVTTPVQASAWKTSAANRVGDKNWEAMAYAPESKQFEKQLSRGLKLATEDAVERTSGATEAQALRQHNDELGRLLTSQDRADHMARLEGRKNHFSSVDGMIAGAAIMGEGHGNHDMSVLGLVKKAADIAKATGPRTTTGLALQDLGQTPIPDAVMRRILIDQNNPWSNVK